MTRSALADGRSPRIRPSGVVAKVGRRATKRIAEAVLPASVVVWRGSAARSRKARRVALTFDDGPSDLTTAYLDALAHHRARATFFVVGESCAERRDLVLAISAAGHELAVHGYTHRRFTTLASVELEDELHRSAALLPSTSSERRLVRPPHGAVSPNSLLTCARAGFTTVLWSYDSGDSRTTRAVDVVTAFDDDRAREPGAIVLLHEGHPWTAQALPSILHSLEEEGHDLCTVGELLDG